MPNFKNVFFINTSFYEPIKEFSNEELGILFRCIFEYQISKKEPMLSNSKLNMAFMFFKTQFSIFEKKTIKHYKETKMHSFLDSPFYEKNIFTQQFKWDLDKINYYYQAAIDYSESKNAKYANWVSAIRSWERKDKLEKKGYYATINSVEKQTLPYQKLL